MAQVVARYLGVVEVASSSLVTPTNKNDNFRQKVVVFLLRRKSISSMFHSRNATHNTLSIL